jgi:hypothetical protein
MFSGKYKLAYKIFDLFLVKRLKSKEPIAEHSIFEWIIKSMVLKFIVQFLVLKSQCRDIKLSDKLFYEIDTLQVDNDIYAKKLEIVLLKDGLHSKALLGFAQIYNGIYNNKDMSVLFLLASVMSNQTEINFYDLLNAYFLCEDTATRRYIFAFGLYRDRDEFLITLKQFMYSNKNIDEKISDELINELNMATMDSNSNVNSDKTILRVFDEIGYDVIDLKNNVDTKHVNEKRNRM